MNPFKIKYIPTSQELLDISFHKTSKLALKVNPRKTSIQKASIKEITRIKDVSSNLKNRIIKIVKSFPTIDKIHPFYFELTNILVDVKNLKNLLASINGIYRVMEEIEYKTIKKIRSLENPKEIAQERINFYGRISSLLYKMDKKLNELRKIRRILIKLPSVYFDMPTIVVAGYPNVGKSSLVKQISTATPKVDYYPFTTRSIYIGYKTFKGKKIQILDTPGLLDRELFSRNNIELQAIVALKYLANKIVYIFDPSETCGYNLINQINLYHDICKYFPDIPLTIIFNKIDLISKEKLNEILEKEKFEYEIFYINALVGEGIPQLMEKLFDKI